MNLIQNQMNCDLNKLPAELKIILLESFTDFSSLSKFLQALPAYHDLYTINREKILKATAFNILNSSATDIAEAPEGRHPVVCTDTETTLVKYQRDGKTGEVLKVGTWHWGTIFTVDTAEYWMARANADGTSVIMLQDEEAIEWLMMSQCICFADKEG